MESSYIRNTYIHTYIYTYIHIAVVNVIMFCDFDRTIAESNLYWKSLHPHGRTRHYPGCRSIYIHFLLQVSDNKLHSNYSMTFFVFCVRSLSNNKLISVDHELVYKMMDELNYVPKMAADENKKSQCHIYRRGNYRDHKDTNILCSFPINVAKRDQTVIF